MELLPFLKEMQINFEQHHHPAVFTCAEVDALEISLPGTATKNLFLRNRKGSRHFLISVPQKKNVDLKALEGLLDCGRLSFASAERLERHLAVSTGSVSLLALINDSLNAVECIIDASFKEAESLCCHPLINTETLVIPLPDLLRFLESIAHPPRWLDVPSQ